MQEDFIIEAGQVGLRIDKFLSSELDSLSRTSVQSAITAGFVTVNEQTSSNRYRLRLRDHIKIHIPQKSNENKLEAQDLAIDVVFEDEHIIIVNKAANMLVHPGKGNYDHTLLNGLLYRYQDLPARSDSTNHTGHNYQGRQGIVHRIDKDTTGLLVVAKTEKAMIHLSEQFAAHTIKRKYIALVWGEPKEETGTINKHLIRHPKDRTRYAVDREEKGRHAVTHYKLIEKMRYVSLLECQLETGRTHQIRVHLQDLGHPIFNDSTYGGHKILFGNPFSKYKRFVENTFAIIPRQALHAKELGFIHPKTKEYIEFDSEIPKDMASSYQKMACLCSV